MGKAADVKLAPEHVATRVFTLRGDRVLLEENLAALYGVETRRLNEQVRRNRQRFPKDFAFQLNNQDLAALRSQIAISNIRASRGGRRYTPFAFTEHGAIMAASVLNTPRAIEVSVYVVRAFVRLRGLLATNKELARRFDQLETRIENRLADQDGVIVEILQAIRQLMAPPPTGPKRKIGFV